MSYYTRTIYKTKMFRLFFGVFWGEREVKHMCFIFIIIVVKNAKILLTEFYLYNLLVGIYI
jgi:hypothetical protein